jgi:hypothetical protein
MREERRGWGSASSVVVVGCLDLGVSWVGGREG